MRKRLLQKRAESILNECAKIEAENRRNRDQMLERQADFRKRFDEARSDIENLRKSIRNTMREVS